MGWKGDGGGSSGRLDGGREGGEEGYGEESEEEMVGCLVVRTDGVGFEGLEGVERLVMGID